MKLRTFLYRHVNTVKRARNVLIALNLLSMGLSLICYLLATRQKGLPFSADALGRDFLLNLPALAYIFFLGVRFRHSRHTPSNRKTFFTLTVLPYLSIFIMYVPLLFNPLMNIYVGETDELRRLLLPSMLSNLMLMLLFSFSYIYTRATQTRLNLIWAEHEKTRFQFQVLKGQLNPHFLFNALNVAASLPYEDPERASQFIKQLGTVYRYMLQTGNKQVVTLRTELEFVRSYLYLQHVRFEDKLQVTIEADETLMERHVVPCGVQMLVENALKHNTCTTENPLRVSIVAEKEGVSVSNNIQLREPGERPGHGLENLRLQYAQLDQIIEVRKDKKQFVVRLPFV